MVAYRNNSPAAIAFSLQVVAGAAIGILAGSLIMLAFAASGEGPLLQRFAEALGDNVFVFIGVVLACTLLGAVLGALAYRRKSRG